MRLLFRSSKASPSTSTTCARRRPPWRKRQRFGARWPPIPPQPTTLTRRSAFAIVALPSAVVAVPPRAPPAVAADAHLREPRVGRPACALEGRQHVGDRHRD